MDDLLDIDWSKQTGSTGPAAQQNGGSRNGTGMSSYSFEALTRSMPTNSSSTQRPHKPAPSQGQAPTSASADAFSSLLGFDSSGPASNSSSLSMAERLKQGQSTPVMGHTIPQGHSKPAVTRKSDPTWDGLDDFIGGTSKPASVSTSAASGPAMSKPSDDLWDFAAPKQPSAPHKHSAHGQAASASALHKPVSKDPFDFSDFEDPADYQSSALGGDGPPPQRTRDSGAAHRNRKEGKPSVGKDEDEGDDSILGSLGRPARPLASAYQGSDGDFQPPARQSVPPRKAGGAASPPPHIIGKVVEMGFSPQQARDALSRTNGGQDVQAALEMLLHESGQDPGSGRDTPARQRRGDGREEEERDRRMAMRLQKEEQARQTRGQGPGARWQGEADPSRAGTPDWQKQADQLYAQASELGANMFSKANAFWSTAKTQAQRALEEHNLGSGSGSGQSSGRTSPAAGSERARSRRWAVPARDGGARKEWQGKPKWMIDAEAEQLDGDGNAPSQVPRVPQDAATSSQGFKDDDMGVDEAPPFLDRAQAVQALSANSEEVRAAGNGALRQEADLWGSEGQDTASQRRPSPVVPTGSSRKAVQRPAGRSPVPQADSHPAGPKRLRERPVVQDDASAIEDSMRHKQRGNELFKRGAYGEAETAYTTALGALDANPHSVRRVALFNNRANARLKNGDAKGALEDTMSILRLIVVSENEKTSPFLLFRPSQETPLPTPDYAGVNLREGYAKALLRRAQAEEMLERWDPALSVWSLLEKYEREEGSGPGGVANMRAAQEGKGRCGKMLKGDDLGPPTTAASNPRVRAAAARAVAKAEAQAKERIRTENAAAAAEELAKDQLRDSIDARVVAWKTGKENNVRALLASLHDAVWPGLGWKRVGMHELVMDNQVKKCYMRAIGKLHPDKLTPKSNTLEERMLGGAVFSVLNDAWSAAQSA